MLEIRYCAHCLQQLSSEEFVLYNAICESFAWQERPLEFTPTYDLRWFELRAQLRTLELDGYIVTMETDRTLLVKPRGMEYQFEDDEILFFCVCED